MLLAEAAENEVGEPELRPEKTPMSLASPCRPSAVHGATTRNGPAAPTGPQDIYFLLICCQATVVNHRPCNRTVALSARHASSCCRRCNAWAAFWNGLSLAGSRWALPGRPIGQTRPGRSRAHRPGTVRCKRSSRSVACSCIGQFLAPHPPPARPSRTSIAWRWGRVW